MVYSFEKDLETEKILFKDYVLFYTTFFLGDRKSESYALQWKHINTSEQEIQLVQALDKYKNPKSTKGNKKTTFRIPSELTDLLQEWKKQQKLNWLNSILSRLQNSMCLRTLIQRET